MKTQQLEKELVAIEPSIAPMRGIYLADNEYQPLTEKEWDNILEPSFWDRIRNGAGGWKPKQLALLQKSKNDKRDCDNIARKFMEFAMVQIENMQGASRPLFLAWMRTLEPSYGLPAAVEHYVVIFRTTNGWRLFDPSKWSNVYTTYPLFAGQKLIQIRVIHM